MTGQPETGDRKHAVLREILDWLRHILIAVLIGLLLVVFVVQRNEVIGSSMEPTLHTGDQLIVEKVSKLVNAIHYGDIVTVDAQGLPGHIGEKNIIKRVIGLGGDTIEVKNGKVFRDGVELVEPYVHGLSTLVGDPAYAKVVLAENEIFVLGDNREVSLDSRRFGPIARSRVIGHVLLRFYPLNAFGTP
jgi:signal peptidase I